MDEEQVRTIKWVRLLLGRWRGTGDVKFPTIPTLEYREELEFAANDVQPFVRYEQRAYKKVETGEYTPSHWETGFWRVLPTDEIEILNAQGGGRVEILRGSLEPARDGFLLKAHSVLVANDARMDKTMRQFIFRGDTLEYTLQMSTTSVPDLTLHAQAILTRHDT